MTIHDIIKSIHSFIYLFFKKKEKWIYVINKYIGFNFSHVTFFFPRFVLFFFFLVFYFFFSYTPPTHTSYPPRSDYVIQESP